MTDAPPDPTPDEPNEPPTPPTPPDPEQVAQEHHEKVPEWGQALIERVDAVLETIVPNGEGDSTPKREPWHKRGPK